MAGIEITKQKVKLDKTPTLDSGTEHVDGKKFRIKTIRARNGGVIIESKEGQEYNVTIKQLMERLQAIRENMYHPAVLPEESKEIDRLTAMSMKAVKAAYAQLGKTNLPDSVKLFLATGN